MSAFKKELHNPGNLIAIVFGALLGLAMSVEAQRITTDDKQMVFGPSCACERYERGGCYVDHTALTYLVVPPAAYVSKYCAGGRSVTVTATLYLSLGRHIGAVFIYEEQ